MNDGSSANLHHDDIPARSPGTIVNTGVFFEMERTARISLGGNGRTSIDRGDACRSGGPNVRGIFYRNLVAKDGISQCRECRLPREKK